MTEALRLCGVTAGHGETVVVQDVSLSLARGARLAVIGRNGVGKTTLLATIMGLTRHRAGRIALDGADITALPPHRRAALGLGLVPQTRDVFPSLSVEENLLAGAMGGRAEAVAGLERSYALFPRLAERRRSGGGQLSGGEQQMLAIARTLMGGPRVLLLDEPLEGLAPVICEALMAAFEALAADGRHTLVLVEQHAHLALGFADRAVVLDQGRIVHDGPAAALAADPDRLNRLAGVGLR